MNLLTLNELLLLKDNGPHISVIVSTELKSFSDKEKMVLKFKNIVDRIKRQLQTKYDEKTINVVVEAIKDKLKQIDLNHVQNGIGIYASPSFVRQVVFPFPVSDKIIINDYFEVSDVIATLDKLIDYSVLLLSKNKTRFFRGNGNELIEIIDENFPQHFEDEYQMERTPSNYMKNNGVEVSQVKSVRLEDYFRKIDKLIDNYVSNEPLVILGVIKHLSTFKMITKHENLVVSELVGNYDKNTIHSISELVWPEVENYRKKEKILHSSHL